MRTFLRAVLPVLLALLLNLFYIEKLSASDFSVDSVASLFRQAEVLGHFVDQLPFGELAKLPLIQSKKIGNITYDLLLANVRVKAGHALADVFLRVNMPHGSSGNTKLYFGSQEVKITKGGYHLDQVKLALMGDYEIFGKGGALRLVLKSKKKNGDGLPQTYCVVDCDGFKELSIAAELIFSSKYLHPVIAGQVRKDKELSTSFHCTATDFSDVMAEIEIPEFVLANFSSWRFSAPLAIFDFSDLRNYEYMDFYAADYPGTFPEGDMKNTWTGVFISELKISLPPFFRNSKGEDVFTSFGAKNLWIDQKGFGGSIISENILHLKEGSIGGWGASVDYVELGFASNRLCNGEIRGKILLPIDMDNALNYSAIVNDSSSMLFKVQMDKALNMSFLKAANVKLNQSSYVSLSIEEEEKPHLKAVLSGSLNINPFDAEDSLKTYFGNIAFKSMTIQNREPYFSVKEFSYDQDIKINGFPAFINDISLNTAKSSNPRLDFDTHIQLTNNLGGNYKGALGLSIYAQIAEVEGKQKWTFEKVNIKDIAIHISTAGFSVKGSVKFLRDSKIYGDGFQGDATLSLLGKDNLKLSSKLMFGKVNNFRYWYADALVDLGKIGIPIFAGLSINGFGGGAYYGVRSESDFESNISGERYTVTGLRYVPDSTRGLGLKAYVIVADQANTVLNCELALAMSFNRNKGLASVEMYGVGRFMSVLPEKYFKNMSDNLQNSIRFDEVEKAETKRQSLSSENMLTATVVMQYNIQEKEFFASMEAYMNSPFLKGSGSLGHMGKSEMYFGPDKWFFYIGTPKYPLGITFQLPPLKLRTTAYFMSGHDIPEMPPLPDKVERLFRDNEKTELSNERDINSIRGGRGVAFGSNLQFSTGQMNLLIFYADFEAQLGFDIMMKQYKGLSCRGRDGLGINAWYAFGQAYTYLRGDVGLRLDWLGARRNISILEGEMAVLLRAKLPNPAWFQGGLAFNYSVLNGLIKGRAKFAFELGEKCDVVNEAFASGVGIISDIIPSDSSEQVDVLSAAKASFNIPIGQSILPLDGQDREIDIRLDYFRMRHEGKIISAKHSFNEEKNVLVLSPNEMLPAKAKIDIELRISVFEKKADNWVSFKDAKGAPYYENKQLSFVTGDLPDSIPLSMLAYTYPVLGQKYFLPSESTQGYICLKQGMKAFFESPVHDYLAVFSSETDSLEAPIRYLSSSNMIKWNMPILKNGKNYQLKIIARKKRNAFDNNALTAASESFVSLYQDGDNTVEQKQIKLSQTAVSGSATKVLLNYSFASSRYANLEEKINSIQMKKVYKTSYLVYNTKTGKLQSYPLMHYFQAEMSCTEAFDSVELYGNQYSGGQALIKASADLKNNAYYLQDIYPLIYQYYPYRNLVRFTRTKPNHNIVPDWAVYVSQYYFANPTSKFPWIYYLPCHYKWDFDELIAQLVNAKICYNMGLMEYNAWFSKNFVPVKKGNYGILLKYVFPNGEVGNTSKKVFYNPY